MVRRICELIEFQKNYSSFDGGFQSVFLRLFRQRGHVKQNGVTEESVWQENETEAQGALFSSEFSRVISFNL